MKTENPIQVKINDCLLKVSTCSPQQVFNDTTFRYIDISSIDNSSKQITGATDIIGNDAPSRARQILKDGDIILSTVRPNLLLLRVFVF
jgi:type I restriction enzyme S subunit